MSTKAWHLNWQRKFASKPAGRGAAQMPRSSILFCVSPCILLTATLFPLNPLQSRLCRASLFYFIFFWLAATSPSRINLCARQTLMGNLATRPSAGGDDSQQHVQIDGGLLFPTGQVPTASSTSCDQCKRADHCMLYDRCTRRLTATFASPASSSRSASWHRFTMASRTRRTRPCTSAPFASSYDL